MSALVRWRFARRGPWVGRFEVAGGVVGGGYDATADARITTFARLLPDARRVLELGCLDGAAALELARSHGRTVLGVDGHAGNVARARYVARALAVRDVAFHEADLRVWVPSSFGRFDAVVSLGVLSHLPDPWRVVDGLRAAAPAAFVWTHVATDAEADAALDGSPGAWYREPDPGAPGAGPSRRSFWPTASALVARLRAAGFSHVTVVDDDPAHPNAPAVLVLATA